MKNMQEMCHLKTPICTMPCFDLGSSQFDTFVKRKSVDSFNHENDVNFQSSQISR